MNIVAHSMGGLDARYMISHLQPKNVDVRSLVTVASPHRGSAFADYLFKEIGSDRLPSIYKFVEGVGMDTGAFQQLTRSYMAEKFNPQTPDDPNVRYFSYGAMMEQPPLLSPFRYSHGIVSDVEGPNDGLVSVTSSQWGSYKGTLVGVSHLDLINWTNRVKWTLRKWMGQGPTYVFNNKPPPFACANPRIASTPSPFTLTLLICLLRKTCNYKNPEQKYLPYRGSPTLMCIQLGSFR